MEVKWRRPQGSPELVLETVCTTCMNAIHHMLYPVSDMDEMWATDWEAMGLDISGDEDEEISCQI